MQKHPIVSWAAACNSAPDLFGWSPAAYPNAPGFKSGQTSRDAARAIAGHAATVRANTLKEFCAAFPRGMTADECARLLGVSILTVRPRVSELRAAGMLEPTHETKPNAESGHAARVLRSTAKAMELCR
jgi:hypothetical protein